MRQETESLRTSWHNIATQIAMAFYSNADQMYRKVQLVNTLMLRTPLGRKDKKTNYKYNKIDH